MGIWPFRKTYRTVDVEGARRMLRDGAVLIDVRSRGEWNTGHAREARHVPLDRIEQSLPSLSPDVPVVTICHSGVRSASAARLLAKRGYQVATVRGGMIAWNRR